MHTKNKKIYMGINVNYIERTANSCMNKCSNDKQLAKDIQDTLKKECNLDNLYIYIKSGEDGGIHVNEEFVEWDKFSSDFRHRMIKSYKNNSNVRSM